MHHYIKVGKILFVPFLFLFFPLTNSDKHLNNLIFNSNNYNSEYDKCELQFYKKIKSSRMLEVASRLLSFDELTKL